MKSSLPLSPGEAKIVLFPLSPFSLASLLQENDLSDDLITGWVSFETFTTMICPLFYVAWLFSL